MPTQTPRFGLNKYAADESPWTHDDLVDFVDDHGIERDTLANRPASGDYNWQLFYATDEKILYTWNSTDTVWEKAIKVAPQLVHEPDETPFNVIFGREFFSNSDTTVYVDPGTGSDTNDGTSGNPYATLDRALEDVPFWLMHEFQINLADGTYSGEPADLATPPIRANFQNVEGRLRITGNITTPSNVILSGPSGFNTSVNGTEAHDGMVIEGVDIQCDIRSYSGVLWIEDCVLHNPVKGYNCSIAVNASTYNVTSGTPDAAYALQILEGGFIMLQNVDGEVSTAILRDGNHANCLVSVNNSALIYPAVVETTTDPGMVTVDGELQYPSIPNTTLNNDSVTVAGNTVALGGSTGVDLADLGLKPHSALDDAPTSAHHVRPSAGRGLVEGASATDAFDIEERVAYQPGHTEWEDGLANEEVARWLGVTGQNYVIAEIQFMQKGGGTSTSASFDIYDVTAASQVMTTDLGSRNTTNTSVPDGNEIIARVTNSTGGVINAMPYVDGWRT